MSLRRSTFPALGASLLVLVAVAGSLRFGPVVLVALVALSVGLALLARPEWALAAAIGLPLLVESEPDWGPSAIPSRLYQMLPGFKFSLLEVLVLTALIAALLSRRAVQEPFRSLGIVAGPLALLALGLVAGTVVGSSAGVDTVIAIKVARNVLLLFFVALAVVQVVGTVVTLRTALGAALALAAVKAVLGIAALVTGQTASSVGGQPLTYYDAPANVLVMFGLLFIAAAALRRVRLPPWAWAAAPLMIASLLLSYRRSFWVAAMLGLILVLLFAVGRQSRRVGIPAAIALVVALVLTFGSGLGSGLTSTSATGRSGLGGRVQSLNPTAISRSRDDRFRIGERRNVLADLADSPIGGLGLGVGYRARYPLSIGSIPRTYVHFGALWWWMNAGILGLVGYSWIMLAGVWAGVVVLRRHPDRAVRAAGLAAAAGLVGYAVAELTATFTGPDARSNVLMGAILGLVAVAHREAQAAPAESRHA